MNEIVGSFLPLAKQAPLAQPRRAGAERQSSRKVAEDFTAVFTSLVVKEMLKSVSLDGSSPYGNGPGASVYQGLAENAMSEALAKTGLSSLTDHIQQLIDDHPLNPANQKAAPIRGPHDEEEGGA